LRLPFLYLGYWIGESPKMSYKARFRPVEILRGGRWERLREPAQRR
jgi:arginine-tRNA-protein transferase